MDCATTRDPDQDSQSPNADLSARILVPATAVRAFDEWLGRPAWLPRVATAQIALGEELAAFSTIVQRLGACGIVDLLRRSRHRLCPSFNGLAVTYAPTLEAAMSSALRALVADAPHLRADSAIEQGRHVIRLSFVRPLGPAETAIGLIFVASALRCLESCASIRREQIGVHCALPEPLDPRPWLRLVPSPISFGQGWAITYPAVWDRQRNPLYDRGLWEMGQRSLASQATLQFNDGVVAHVRRIVADTIATGEGPPPLQRVAHRLGRSVRSLERRLMDEGSSFRDITESERKRRALELLADAGRPIQEVSDRLGFSDRTSFTRSFRSWFGVPPARYRSSGSIRA